VARIEVACRGGEVVQNRRPTRSLPRPDRRLRTPLSDLDRSRGRLALAVEGSFVVDARFDDPPIVYVQKCKRPAGSGLWGTYDIGTDGHGTWLYTPVGSLYRGIWVDGRVGYCNVGSPSGPGQPVLGLVPHDRWWVATFWPPGDIRFSLTVDLCLPTVRGNDGIWRYVDTELDLLVTSAGGEVVLCDEDELVDAHRDGFVSDHEDAMTRSAANEVAALIRSGSEPFAQAGDALLRMAMATQLTPITQLPPA
jgi:hypothetical protein